MQNNNVIGLEELAREKLNEKYKEKFEIEKIIGIDTFRGYYTAVAYSEENPDTPFRVMVDNDGAGISDNYVTKLLCRELSDRIGQNLDSMEGIYLIHSVMLFDLWELSDPGISLADFFDYKPDMEFGIYLFYCPDHKDADNICDAVSNMLKGLELFSGNLFLYICDEQILKQVQDYWENNDRLYDSFYSMVDSYNVANIECEKGNVLVSKSEIADKINGK